jgi:hypothetical protein
MKYTAALVLALALLVAPLFVEAQAVGRCTGSALSADLQRGVG